MMKTILTSGCSFTETACEKNNWPAFLDKSKYNVVNLGLIAAGNKYIADSIMSYIIHNPDTVDYVVVMWSGITRIDVTVGAESDFAFAATQFPFRKILDSRLYICSAIYGCPPEHPFLREHLKDYYRYATPESVMTDSVTEIIKLQSFLQAKQIPYVFTSYINYWTNDGIEEVKGRAGDTISLASVRKLAPFVDQIDFSKFLFFDNEKKTTIGEVAHINGWMKEDKIHPDHRASKAFADLVNTYLQSNL